MLPERSSASSRVLDVLKGAGGGLSVKDLCRELDLSSMAVRRHLGALESRRLVSSQREKGKTGRPSRLYYLTDQGHEEFSRDYCGLALDLLVGTRSLCGKQSIADILEHRNTRLLEAVEKRIRGRTLEARVHEVAQWLTESGYMATWEKLGPNRYLIREMNCAVAQVARRFPLVCICEESLLGDLLKAKVKRRHHILHKDQFCSYLVEAS